MHRVFWGVHRTSLCAIKVAKKIMARFGLTPSRFHMLFAIKCERVAWFPQRGLRELLGISAQTISRMIKSLVACEYLVQRVVPEDRRRRVLAFTELGKEKVGRAFCDVVQAGLGAHVAGRALTDQGWPMPAALRAEQVQKFDQMLDQLRWGLNDNALFAYWPENQEPMPVYSGNIAFDDYQDSTPDLTTLDDDPQLGF